MNYTVIWKPQAERDLTEAWLAATDRNLIAHSVHQIDSALGDHPLDVGESREADDRVLCVLPLVVGYRVSEDDRLVTVVRMRIV